MGSGIDEPPRFFSQLPLRGQQTRARLGDNPASVDGETSVELRPLISSCVTVGKSLTLSEPQPPPTLLVGILQGYGRGG